MESQHIFNGDMTRAARILVKVSAQYIARDEASRVSCRSYVGASSRLRAA